MDPLSSISDELAEINGQIADIFRALSNGFQKLEKIKDANRQSRQLEELTEKMRECKRYDAVFSGLLKSLMEKLRIWRVEMIRIPTRCLMRKDNHWWEF
ncbi:hypothetical protein EZV62_003115 [Acer yangbiense]|uniref:Uncharacterized protein n=1 Tax=Acer yangbiense TaxID=1000413 RepID=A0A5C7IFV1_9ROSI|nr:hypothetical protein EZV62_003115 [Acer yangbiense]